MKGIYGTLAEFAEPEGVLRASRAAYAAGFRRLDAFAPFPVEGLSEAIGFHEQSIAAYTLLGAVAGAVTGFGMEWYSNVVDYPINIGGRPYFSWPAFVPIIFELGVLGAALTGAFAMLALNRLPKPWHPAFNLPAFARASQDRFFLCIEARDPLYEISRIRALLSEFEPLSIAEVANEVDNED